MQFLSDNAATVHPAVWAAMQAADATEPPYDGDALSARLDEAFAGVFGRRCTALWVASGTAANGLALAAMVEPHRGIICHTAAHIANDECGAPGFYTHGATLMPVGCSSAADTRRDLDNPANNPLPGDHAKLTPEAIAALIAPIRRDVHRVWPQAISITQATEAGAVYTPAEVAALGVAARAQGWRFHMDGARFANAVAHLGCNPAAASCDGGVEALSFGFVKNGGMGAEALVLFDEALAEVIHYRRKRAGHLFSKGRFLAAQLLALLAGDLWLANARAANAAAAEIAAAGAHRLLHPREANEVFLRLSAAERKALRAQGFGFYDWGLEAARFVTAWDARATEVSALARAIAAL